MFHYLPGQHHHVAEWHNEVHRPEIHGAVPHVFYSQDFVAPPGYVSAREHADLPMAGGEYLSLYWSEGPLEQYLEDSRKASQERRNAGSYHPFQDVVWAARLRALAVHGRAGLGYDVNAAPLVPNRGLALLVERVTDQARGGEYTDWLQRSWVPNVLETGLFSACFQFTQDDARGPLLLEFCFVDRADPLESLAALRRIDIPADIAHLRSRVFCGAYQLVHENKYDVYK